MVVMTPERYSSGGGEYREMEVGVTSVARSSRNHNERVRNRCRPGPSRRQRRIKSTRWNHSIITLVKGLNAVGTVAELSQEADKDRKSVV